MRRNSGWLFSSVRIFVAVLMFSPLSAAGAADGFECDDIFPPASVVQEIPGSQPKKVFPTGDLVGLGQHEQRNIRSYVEYKARLGERIPNEAWLLPGPRAARFSLILEDGPCQGKCRGVAVLPSGGQDRFQPFSYRRNFVVGGGEWNWVLRAGGYEMGSTRIGVMDADERRVLLFFDVRRAPLPVPCCDPEAVEVVRSEGLAYDLPDDRLDFSACLMGRLKRRQELPRISTPEAR